MEKNKGIQKKTEELEVFWLRLSHACNNNCIFCLDYENQIDCEEKIIPYEKITAAIKAVKKPQNKKIVLSGGEPTLHPQLLAIIKFAKKRGFKKIQLITNGRLFYYKKFCQQVIAAGLDEITISFHSHLPAIYEQLTGIKGSYQQAWQGLQNILAIRQQSAQRLIVNIDIVVSKINLNTLKQTILFFAHQGVYEFDLLFIIPFGRAMFNQNDLFFDYSLQMTKIRKVLDLNKDPRFHIWLNRFPPEFLSGYEIMIQAPAKLFDEIRGRQPIFQAAFKNKKRQLACYAKERCPRCYIKGFCQAFRKLVFKKTQPAQPKLMINLEKFLAQPQFYLHKYAQTKVILKLPVFKKTDWQLTDFAQYKIPQEWVIENIPRCLIGSNKNKVIFSQFPVLKAKLDLEKLVSFYIDKMYFLKPLSCQACVYSLDCQGLNINYVKNCGFNILRPIKN